MMWATRSSSSSPSSRKKPGERVSVEQVFVADPVRLAAHDVGDAVLVLALHFDALAFAAVLYD